MKTCPNCRESFQDDQLNFCLNCGSNLSSASEYNPPPTVIMNTPRQTNPNFGEHQNFGTGAPLQSWQSPPLQNMTFNQAVQGADQTLPIISLTLGVLGLLLFCCFGGIPLGLGAIITGYLGMKNADTDPQRYSGKGLAIGGIILGAIALIGGLIGIIFSALS